MRGAELECLGQEAAGAVGLASHVVLIKHVAWLGVCFFKTLGLNKTFCSLVFVFFKACFSIYIFVLNFGA